MTARRTAFFALTAGVLIAALYTGERLYVIVLFILLALLALAVFHIAYTLHAFSYYQSLSKSAAVKGDSVRLSITLYNEGWIPYGRVRATYWLPDCLRGAPPHVLEGDVPAHGALSCEVDFACLHRGEYHPGLLSVRVSDVFGLFSASMRYEKFSYQALRLTVRPRVTELSDEARVAMVRQGRMESEDTTAQEVSAVRDIRAYRSGDALKRVHFKLSARRRSALVKEFEGSARPNTLLLLDVQAHGREGAEALEIEDAMVEAATALAHGMLEMRAPVRLVGYGAGRFEAAGSEPRNFDTMYAYLTVVKFDGKYSLTDVLALETSGAGQHVVLITSAIDPKLYGAMLALREAGDDVAAVVAATRAERVDGVDRFAAELNRHGVRCMVISPGDAPGNAPGNAGEAAG